MRNILAAALIAASSLVFSTSGIASAHARLDRSTPEPDSVVDLAPAEVRIWTTQELTLRGHSVVVTDAQGARVDSDDTHIDQTDVERKQVVVSLPPLGPGSYTVTYTTVSLEDGHDYTDSFIFTIAGAAGEPAGEPAAGAEPAY